VEHERTVETGELFPYNPEVPERGRLLRAATLLALGAFVILTWLPRAWAAHWIADDWCFAVSSVRDGFWRSQALVYNSAAGRFTVAFLYAVFTRLGPWAARWLSIGAMAVWLFASWRVAKSRFTGLDAVAAAIGFVATVLNAAPDTYQPLIWTGGLLTYGVPVIGATCVAASALARRNALAVILAFITGGCSEVAAVAQIVFATVFALMAPRYRRGHLRRCQW